MQAQLTIKCSQCGKQLGEVVVDTASMPEQLQAKVNAVILRHRSECRYYEGKAQ